MAMRTGHGQLRAATVADLSGRNSCPSAATLAACPVRGAQAALLQRRAGLSHDELPASRPAPISLAA
jgi:hypothetical protein